MQLQIIFKYILSIVCEKYRYFYNVLTMYLEDKYLVNF